MMRGDQLRCDKQIAPPCTEDLNMKNWLTKARELLEASLRPPRHELNELDWKAALSPNKKRLTEHLSAFSNWPGGGFLVFGIESDGTPAGVDETQVETVINKLAGLGRDALEPPIALDHTVESWERARLLLVHVPESSIKPVHLRGKSLDHAFIRSGGTTRRASRQEIGAMMLHSRMPRWEELRASVLMAEADLLGRLNVEPILEMLGHPIPTDFGRLVDWMTHERFVTRESAGGFFVTNLGAVSSARDLALFPDLSRKAVRLIVYAGVNKTRTMQEQELKQGYAIGFRELMDRLMSLLPQTEVIRHALREKRTVYPEIALREVVANALIHQDFTISGAGPLIEIFDDRVEVSNPGGLLPSKRLDRLIGTQPESRNEQLARAFRRYGICEERGSGLLKAGNETELYGLPPIHFSAGPNHFKVTLFAPRAFSRMSSQERLDACYQHAVLRYFSSSAMTNKSLRERLKLPESRRSQVTALIQQALDRGLVKPADPESKSRKFAEYVPAWA
ncbi:MAG: ATP-binding protein [Thermodesulfobacteriota bacterium]